MPEIKEYLVVDVDNPSRIQSVLNSYLNQGYLLHSVVVITGVGVKAVMFRVG